MAKSLSRLAIVITIVALVLLQFCSLIRPVACTSRKALRGHHQRKQAAAEVDDGFRVELKHVDHGKNLTKLQRIRRAVMRANRRVEQLRETTSMSTTRATASPSSSGIRATVHPGQGEFLVNLSIGTPPLPLSAIVDTGSDLIWTQCEPCVHCYRQPSPIFRPAKSSSYAPLPCDAALCSALPIPSCSDDQRCAYTYEYGDYSTTSGTLATETLTFSASKSVPRIGFGCGHENQGGGFDQGGGLVGLGRGPLSLVSQLKDPKFSYCLSNGAGTLLLGSLADATLSNKSASASAGAVTTPLAKNPAQPSFYYVSLQGISVGGARLPIPKSAFKLNDHGGSGGMIIDSGTTITYLDGSAYGPLRAEILNRVKLHLADNSSVADTGLDLCFEMPAGDTGAANGFGFGFGTVPADVEVPTMVFHFENADLEIPPENYMVAVAAEVQGAPDMLCLAMGDGSGSGMSVFGNIQQQNMLVLHDLRKETLTFVPTNCEAL